MVVLVPFKPVAVVLGLLSALIFVTYFGSALIHGRDPFAVGTGNWQHATAQHVSNHSSTVHRTAPKEHAEPTE